MSQLEGLRKLECIEANWSASASCTGGRRWGVERARMQREPSAGRLSGVVNPGCDVGWREPPGEVSMGRQLDCSWPFSLSIQLDALVAMADGQDISSLV